MKKGEMKAMWQRGRSQHPHEVLRRPGTDAPGLETLISNQVTADGGSLQTSDHCGRNAASVMFWFTLEQRRSRRPVFTQPGPTACRADCFQAFERSQPGMQQVV